MDPFVVIVQAYLPPPSLRHVDPDSLPIWLPEERQSQECFELIRDHWWVVKRYADEHGIRGVKIVDRASAERIPEGWPPPIYIRYRGKEYGVGTCQPIFDNLALQARMNADPRRVRVLVMVRPPGAGPADPSDAREYLFHLDRGPAGAKLAGRDRPPRRRA